MKKAILICSMFLLACFEIQAQEFATTKDGKRVVLNNNGTWKYADSVTATNDCSRLIYNRTSSNKSYPVTVKDLVISNDGGKTGFKIFAFNSATSNTTVVTIKIFSDDFKLKCVQEGDKVIIEFTDGRRIEMKNFLDLNCDGNSTLSFGVESEYFPYLSELQSKKIQFMGVRASQEYFAYNFNDAQALEFANVIDCLIKSKK